MNGTKSDERFGDGTRKRGIQQRKNLRALTGFVEVRSRIEVRIESSVKLLLSNISPEKSCTNAE